MRKVAPKTLDTYYGKRPRGRPGVRKSEVQNRASDFAEELKRHWDVLAEPFLKAESEEEFTRLMEKPPPYVQTKFGQHLFPLIQKMRRDAKFPKKASTQKKFFAESLAAMGRVSVRRSRDICAEGRKKKRHKIIRQDYYIECTCSYAGPALHGACPECRTRTIGFIRPIFPASDED